MIRSTWPSPLTSATSTELTRRPVRSQEETEKLPEPSLISTTSVLSKKSVLIKSGFPSPLTSAVVTEKGRKSNSFHKYREWARTKPPLPLLVSTVSVSSPRFALIRSTLPSPFTSAAATERGARPTAGEEAVTKLPKRLEVQLMAPKELAVARFTLVKPAASPANVP